MSGKLIRSDKRDLVVVIENTLNREEDSTDNLGNTGFERVATLLEKRK